MGYHCQVSLVLGFFRAGGREVHLCALVEVRASVSPTVGAMVVQAAGSRMADEERI